jgi:antitoxin component of MazEF toxin-antitoxin module
MITRIVVLLFTALVLTLPARSQDDVDIDEQIKKAMAAPPKSAAEMKEMQKKAEAQMKEMTAENDKAEAEQKAKDKAAAQAALKAKGPIALPDWTPQVPQFTPSGPLTRKLVDGQPRTVLTGTSPLPPAALADAWDTFKNPKFSHERTGSDINHHADLLVTYRNSEDNSEVKLEAERKPGAKVTQVTISSPLPIPPAEPEK